MVAGRSAGPARGAPCYLVGGSRAGPVVRGVASVSIPLTARAGVKARPERRGGIPQRSPAGEYPPDLPGAGTVLADDRRRPGLAGRASLTRGAVVHVVVLSCFI